MMKNNRTVNRDRKVVSNNPINRKISNVSGRAMAEERRTTSGRRIVSDSSKISAQSIGRTNRAVSGRPQVKRNSRAAMGNDGTRTASRSGKMTSLTKFMLAVMVVAAAVCVILFSNKNVTVADETGEAVALTKYYKTITIEQGDSLWSIADEYKSGDYRTVQDYVNELKSMNNLHSDQISAGQKLVVAYFAE